MQSTQAENVWLAFKVKSPAAGRYMTTIGYKYHYGCNAAAFYLLPGDTEDIDSTLKTARPFATMRYKQDTVQTGALVMQKVGALDVPEEGEYFLVIKVTEPSGALGGAGQSGIHLTSFELDGEEPTPLDSVALSLDNTAISKTNPAHASRRNFPRINA